MDKIGSVYNMERPSHLKDGIQSGITNIIKGAVVGGAAIVMSPYSGAKEQGILGFGKGLFTGITGGVGLALGGAGTGAIQVLRGLYNTKDGIIDGAKMIGTTGVSIYEKHLKSDKSYDNVPKIYNGVYNLKSEAGDFLGISEEYFLQNLPPPKHKRQVQKREHLDRTVVDSSLYDLLGVKTNADDTDIYIAYYTLGN